MHTATTREEWFRIWIVASDGWQPQSWDDLPPECLAVEPAEELPLPAGEAETYLEAYNEVMLDRPGNRWAVAVPVKFEFAGDLAPGQKIIFGENEECAAELVESAGTD